MDDTASAPAAAAASTALDATALVRASTLSSRRSFSTAPSSTNASNSIPIPRTSPPRPRLRRGASMAALPPSSDVLTPSLVNAGNEDVLIMRPRLRRGSSIIPRRPSFSNVQSSSSFAVTASAPLPKEHAFTHTPYVARGEQQPVDEEAVCGMCGNCSHGDRAMPPWAPERLKKMSKEDRDMTMMQFHENEEKGRLSRMIREKQLRDAKALAAKKRQQEEMQLQSEKEKEPNVSLDNKDQNSNNNVQLARSEQQSRNGPVNSSHPPSPQPPPSPPPPPPHPPKTAIELLRASEHVERAGSVDLVEEGIAARRTPRPRTSLARTPVAAKPVSLASPLQQQPSFASTPTQQTPRLSPLSPDDHALELVELESIDLASGSAGGASRNAFAKRNATRQYPNVHNSHVAAASVAAETEHAHAVVDPGMDNLAENTHASDAPFALDCAQCDDLEARIRDLEEQLGVLREVVKISAGNKLGNSAEKDGVREQQQLQRDDKCTRVSHDEQNTAPKKNKSWRDRVLGAYFANTAATSEKARLKQEVEALRKATNFLFNKLQESDAERSSGK